jgi:hypothetical protein
MDILLLDVLDNAPFCVEKTFKVCPVEMVVGAVEVTRNLDVAKLQADCAKLSRVKHLAEKRCYTNQVAPPCWQPITFVVGFTSNLSEGALEEVVKSIDPPLRPDGILLHDKAFYWLPHSGCNRQTFARDPLFHFIGILRQELDRRRSYGADLRAYLPSSTVPESQESKILGTNT